MANPTLPDLPVRVTPVAEADMLLCGFDAIGFSAIVDRAAVQFGRAAGEYAAGAIESAFAVVGTELSAAGFEPLEKTGDGAVWRHAGARPWRARRLDELCARIRNLHREASGVSVRAAWAAGEVRSVVLPLALVEQTSFNWGPGLARLHRRVAAQRPGWPGRVTPCFATFDRGTLIDEATLFVRIAGPADWPELDEDILLRALAKIDRWALMREGRLHRLTHDDKGVQLRLSLPACAETSRGELEELLAALTSLGLNPAAAATSGPIFRGPGIVVHGAALNRAAKACAALPTGGLSGVGESRPVPRPVALPLVGRRAELARIERWLGAAGPKLLLLTGEPGIGKTHLLGAFARRRRAAGPVAVLTCRFAGLSEPFGAAAAALRHLLDASGAADRDALLAAAGLEPAERALCAPLLMETGAHTIVHSVPVAERAPLIQTGLAALLAATARSARATICLDDAHLCDEGSLTVFERLLKQGHADIAMLLAGRGHERLLATGELAGAANVELGGLADAEIVRIATALASPVRPADIASIALGNPLRAIEAALGSTANGDLSTPTSLARRIAEEPAERLELLHLLALAELPLRIEDIAGLLGRPLEEAKSSAELLIERRLVRISLDGAGLEPAHQTIMEVAASIMPDGVRRKLAARLAKHGVRVRPGWSPAARARLWRMAGESRRAELLYARSGRAALATGSFAAAAELFGEAAAIGAGRGSGRAPMWRAERASALWATGKIRAANGEARAALATLSRAPRARRGPVQVMAAAVRAETGYFLGEFSEMLAGNWAVLRCAGRGLESRLALGRGYSSLGYLAGLCRLEQLTGICVRRGIALSDESGDGRPAAYNRTALAILCFVRGRWAAGEAEIAAAGQALAAQPEEHHLIEVIETVAGLGAHLCGDAARAIGHFERLGARAAARNHDLHQAWADYAIAQAQLAADAPELAWERLQAAMGRMEHLEDRHSRHIAAGIAARLCLARDDPAGAFDHAEQALRWAERLPPTNFSSLEGFSAPPLVAASLRIRGLRDERLEALERRGLRRLRAFARLFPIARPRLALVEALAGPDPERRAGCFARAAAAARELGMEGETKLIETQMIATMGEGLK